MELEAAFLSGLKETILDDLVLNIEIITESHGLTRLDPSRKQNSVACFIKHSVTNNYKTNMCLKTKIIFI